MARLALKEEAAREVLLIRSVESEDGEALVLTVEDRAFATTAALAEAPLGEAPSARETGAFLARRAKLALERLIARYPTLRQVCGLSRWPHWVGWAVPIGALLLGLASNAIEGGRLNILAFPLLGMILWNLVAYLWLLVRALFPRGGGERPLVRLLGRLVRPAAARLAAQPTLERGVQRFAGDWARVSAPLTRHRASRTLHLAAALFALGLLAGMLLRARYTAEYSAGWAGTWAGAEREIAAVLGVVLAPASLLTGIALPTAERLRDLRGAGENAGSWLILWTVTVALFVVIPRLLLAMYNGSRAAFLKRRLTIPGDDDFYVRTLVRNAVGRAVQVRVLPYSFALPPGGGEQVTAMLRAALGDQTQVALDAVPYGEEDRWLAGEGERLGSADQVVILFNLASTPEAENHGAFARGVQQRVATTGTGLTVLLEDSAFRRKLRGGGADMQRLSDRVQAWRHVLAPLALEPAIVSLGGEPADTARTIEQAMLRMPVRR